MDRKERKRYNNNMVNIRKDALVTDETYHVFNKSIAGFKIFNSESDFFRMRETFCYYQQENRECKFSKYSALLRDNPKARIDLSGEPMLVKILAYCIMPTHIHLILKQLKESGVSIFMSNIQNSYARYFNTKYNRKGPLWEGRFKNVLIQTDEQLLHLTRYVHLNPVSAYLVNNPQEWPMSSYGEYIDIVAKNERMCDYEDIMSMDSVSYRNFVEDRISYQRELERIKDLLFE
ncbi:MAG: transposase [Candidatus Omnitrophica bacterium]|nr:transposase [Candidatus Omnitrophota bacterium]